MSKKVYCVAEFRTSKNNEQILFEALMALESYTQREDGCLLYNVTRQIVSTSAKGTSIYNVAVLEIFQDQESFELHNQQDYIKAFYDTYIAGNNKIVEDFCVRLFSDKV